MARSSHAIGMPNARRNKHDSTVTRPTASITSGPSGPEVFLSTEFGGLNDEQLAGFRRERDLLGLVGGVLEPWSAS